MTKEPNNHTEYFILTIISNNVHIDKQKFNKDDLKLMRNFSDLNDPKKQRYIALISEKLRDMIDNKF